MAFVKQICVLSIFFGIIMLLVPEGRIKQITTMLCMVLLMTSCLEAVNGFDFESYVFSISQYRDNSAALSRDSQEMNLELNRLVIEDNCESYIKDKGRELGIEVQQVTVEVEWSMEGLWCPISADIRAESGRNDELVSIVEAELGIPRESIRWSST